MRAQKTTLTALALVAGLSLTACQGSDDSATSKNDSGSSSSSSSSAKTSGGSGASDENAKAAGDDSATTTRKGGSGGQVNTGPCKTKNLTFRASHGMGEGTLLVSLKNTGDACSLKGFPGVDLKADSGPGGLSAERSKLAAPAVVVNSGEETRFTLHCPPNDSGGSGVDITRLVVTPPGETHSRTVPVSINLPVSDGSGDAVTVDPVGTGKQ